MADDLPKNGEFPLKLAERADVRVGNILIRPSLRSIDGPGQAVMVEPRVMQVLLAIVDARGGVTSREELIRRCWDNRVVGDDAVNRAVAELRRALRQAAATVEIETIAKVGYRLVGADVSAIEVKSAGAPQRSLLSRRTAVGGLLALAGGTGAYFALRNSGDDRQFRSLMEQGSQALLYGDPSAQPSRYFKGAMALRPDDAQALGLYAYSQTQLSEFGGPGDPAADLLSAERSANKALSMDKHEPYARLALILIQRSLLDFATTEDRLRPIVQDAPSNIEAMKNLWNLYQSAGRSQDAYGLVAKANQVTPAAPISQYPRAQLLWIKGQIAEADRVIDRAIQSWPDQRFVRFARFTIYAFTGREVAAKAMLADPQSRPQNFTQPGAALWDASLSALASRTAANVAAATRANVDAVRERPALTRQAVMVLSELGQLDAAFELAGDFLAASVDPPTNGSTPNGGGGTGSKAWRFAPWMFTPPLASFRADRRFAGICDAIGLTDYWRIRGVRPDYLLGSR